MEDNQDTSFFKEVKKKLIDLDMTFSELRKRTSYSSDWGLRKALKIKLQLMKFKKFWLKFS